MSWVQLGPNGEVVAHGPPPTPEEAAEAKAAVMKFVEALARYAVDAEFELRAAERQGRKPNLPDAIVRCLPRGIQPLLP
jgi:hypothetical protein